MFFSFLHFQCIQCLALLHCAKCTSSFWQIKDCKYECTVPTTVAETPPPAFTSGPLLRFKMSSAQPPAPKLLNGTAWDPLINMWNTSRCQDTICYWHRHINPDELEFLQDERNPNWATQYWTKSFYVCRFECIPHMHRGVIKRFSPFILLYIHSCNGKNNCTISATNSVFGDPCGGTYKYLEVAYICQCK